MPLEIIEEYEIEYEGVLLPDHHGWGAFVTVYGPSHNPMHLRTIYPRHHVSFDIVFPNEQSAQAEARRVAMEMLQHHQNPS